MFLLGEGDAACRALQGADVPGLERLGPAGYPAACTCGDWRDASPQQNARTVAAIASAALRSAGSAGALLLLSGEVGLLKHSLMCIREGWASSW